MTKLKIIKPDDWHVHFRDGEILKKVVPETCKSFDRAIVMPNLINPIQTMKQIIDYKKTILEHARINSDFSPLMTFYITENLKKSELEHAFKSKNLFACKLYPAGVTTNSDFGINNIENIFSLLEKMEDLGIPLLIHGEVNNQKVDIFYREQVFIEKYLERIIENFPSLKITLEHITTKFSVDYINSKNSKLKASITPHHLIYNRTDMLAHTIKPHLYCLPILKKEEDRQSLLEVALNGNKNFFLGTDSAPHLIHQKESDCGCAGIFNSINCLETLVQLFENNNSLFNLEKFVSINGAKHYSLKTNQNTISFFKKNTPLKFKDFLYVDKHKIKIFRPPFDVFWHKDD